MTKGDLWTHGQRILDLRSGGELEGLDSTRKRRNPWDGSERPKMVCLKGSVSKSCGVLTLVMYASGGQLRISCVRKILSGPSMLIGCAKIGLLLSTRFLSCLR